MRKKTYIKNRIRIFIFSFISIFSLLFGIYLIVISLNIKTYNDVLLLNYNEKSNLDYKVYLKENSYFTEEYLPKDQQYIASIIDYIDVNYNYIFSSSKNIDSVFKYKIVATLTASNNVNNQLKKLWSNDYILLEETVKNMPDSNSFVINENVKIDYQEYNNIINNFKKDYMLSVVSDLKVKLLVEIDGKYVEASEAFNTNSSMVLTIPISTQTLNISMDYNEINNNQILTTKKINKLSNPYIFILGLVITILAIINNIDVIIRIYKDSEKQSKYLKILNKILHDFKDIIIEVKKAPDVPTYRVSEVKNFEELINVYTEIKVPIIFAELKRNEESLFIVNSKDYCYYYILRAKDCEK